MFLITLTLLILLFSLSNISAADLDDSNITQAADSDLIENLDSVDSNQYLESSDDSPLKDNNDEIIVNDWNDLQYYCSLNDITNFACKIISFLVNNYQIIQI